MRRQRGVTHDELALWHHAVRDAAPLRDQVPAPLPLPPVPAPPPSAKIGQVVQSQLPPAPNKTAAPRRLDSSGPVDLDRRSWLKLRRGNYPIDARLDLHGLTQAEAHARLTGFLSTAQTRNRCVLVITGRGVRHGGTLRENTPRWLETKSNRRLVLSYAQARLEHGGEGALYVLLRRRGPGS